MSNPQELARQNNFDFLRFIAAALVILSHAFPLTTGRADTEPVTIVSGGQTSMGHIAVGIFFVISGILITQSFDRSRNLSAFVQARGLRIFPGLVVAIVLSALVLGPAVTSLPLQTYFADPGTYRYLKGVTLHGMPVQLPGVFNENPFAGVVNGSLWTLLYELKFYIVVAIMGMAGLLRRGPVLLAVAGAAVALPFFPAGDSHHLSEFFLFFGTGMLLYLFRDRIRLHNGLALLSLAGLVGTALAGRGFTYAFALGGSYLIFYLAYAPWLRMHGFARHGDLSYGLYIYAFPVQQTLIYLNGGRMFWLANFALALPCAAALAFASWHLVEKRALAWKKASLADWLPGRARPMLGRVLR
jgi:peptidoglycan/LPS O-acetylase OafA/YrhL